MSHFTVLVVGKAPVEAQMARYDENTQVAPYKDRISPAQFEHTRNFYVRIWNDTDIVIQPDGNRRHVGVHQRSLPILPDEPYDYPAIDPNNTKAVLHSYYCNDEADSAEACQECGWDEEGFYHVTTYNQDSQWDWYVEGGRWENSLLTKAGAAVNSCLAGELDVPAMLNARRRDATQSYCRFAMTLSAEDLVWATTPGACGEDPERFAGYVREAYFRASIEVRGEYDSDSRTWSPDSRLPTIEEHIGLKTRWSTYAVVRDGEWHGKAKMGWFGVSSSEHPEQTWYENFAALVGTAPADTPVTLLDCHI